MRVPVAPIAEQRARWVASGVLAACFVWTVWEARLLWAFDTDDAFITLRYAKHLAEGHGITWNVSDPIPVEGYSNFSYLLVAALAFALGSDALLWLKLLGVVSVGVSCLASYHLARRFTGPLAATIPAILLVSYPGTALWAVSGLETTFFMALVLCTFAVFFSALGTAAAHDDPAAPRASMSLVRLSVAGGLALLVGVTRPEGPLVIAVLSLALLLHLAPRRDASGGLRALLALLGPFVIPYAAYTLWRVVHFERLLPNTVLCKVGVHGGSYDVVASYLALAVPYLPFALCHAPGKMGVRHLVLWALPLAYAFMLVGVDPMIAFYNRHVLVAWMALLVLFSSGLANVLGRLLARVSASLREALAVALVLAWIATMGAGPFEFDTQETARTYPERMAARRELGQWLGANLERDEAYLIGDCGMVPYVAEGLAIDAFCLNNRAMTTPPIDGSQDAFIDALLRDPPEYVIVHSLSAERMVPRAEYEFYPKLLEDGKLALRYGLVRKFGVPGDDFHYWVLRRFARPVAAAEAPR